MKSTRKLVAGALALVMALSMAACGSSSSSSSSSTTEAESGAATETSATSEASGTKVFRYAVTTEATTFDPAKGNYVSDNEITHASQEGLVRSVNGVVQEGIAESWEVSDDGLTYTFHLREGAMWSDGVEIKASDFEYAFKRLADPATGSPYQYIVDVFQNGAEVINQEKDPEELGVTTVDDYTLEVTTAYSAPYFLGLIGSCGQFSPVRQDIVEEYGQDYAATADKNVYSGPFVLTSTENKIYIYEKNENYWNADAVNFDRVECTVVENSDTQLSMYENGELDYVKIPNASVSQYEGQDQSYMDGSNDYLYINNKSDNVVLQNKNFRLALNYCLDRNSYNELANDGVYQAWGNFVLPIISTKSGESTYGDTYGDSRSGYPLEGDQTKAQEYLQAAMDELGIANASDITVDLVGVDAESTKKSMEVLQQLIQNALGINVTLRNVSSSEIYNNTYANHDYELGFGGWVPDYDDPYSYLELFKSDNSNNYSQYENAEFDECLTKARSEADADTRMDILAEAENILLEDGALVPLQLRQIHYLLDEDVTGINFSFIGINLDFAFGDCDPT